MALWKWVKLPKAGALLAFFLPWVTLSCSNQVVAKASGWQLVAGDFTTFNALTGAPGLHDGKFNLLLVLAVTAILVGLIASFGRPKWAPLVAVAAALAATLIAYTAHRLSGPDLDRAVAEKAGRQLPNASEILSVAWQAGYYLTLFLLAIAALMALVVAFGRRRAP